MNIDENTLNQIEKLAKLTVNEEDKASTIEKIAFVLDNLDKINLDYIKDLQPLAHPLEISQVLREDVSINQIDREYLQGSSPLVQDGLFIVPKVID